MKRIVVLFLTVCSISLAQAQNAKTLLNDVSSKVKSYNNIVIDFKWNLNNSKEGVNQDTRGNVSIEGNNYLLNMTGITRMFDGKYIYTINPEDEEVVISDVASEEDNAITPSRLLTFYEKGYTYKMDITQTVKGRKIQYVKLVPIDSKAEIKDILLGIDMQSKHIYKLIQTDGNGTKYTLTVNSFKTNQPLSKTLFTFDEAKYKEDGYYIDRLE